MKILGINGWSERGHDGGASLLIDGKLKFAIEEERLVGIRHAYDCIPLESIKLICEKENISIDDIDKVAIGWDYPNLWKMFGSKFVSNEEMSEVLFGTDKYAEKIVYVEHHVAHAASAFYPSKFDRALVLVIDGQGEKVATSVFLGDRRNSSLVKVYETDVSLGYFYAAVTEQVGFYSGQEGKTMGLASSAQKLLEEILTKVVTCNCKKYGVRDIAIAGGVGLNCAALIAVGKIVANFQGRLEFGPRALGNRSILANPRKQEMLCKLNTLKGREVWRPLAPAVLFEEQTRFFSSAQFSPYMTINGRVLENV